MLLKREPVLSKTGCSGKPERVWEGVCVRVRVSVCVIDRDPVGLGVLVSVGVNDEVADLVIDCVRDGEAEPDGVPDVLGVPVGELVRVFVCDCVDEGDVVGEAVDDWLGVPVTVCEAVAVSDGVDDLL